ncbi:MAG: M23 family metallopeptidase [Parcubacteria group bacterium]|nr:M23 family metallopeptidase [Parcubacteria group bacterium]
MKPTGTIISIALKKITLYAYTVYLAVKKKCSKLASLTAADTAHSFINKYGAQIATFFIVIFVVNHNLQAASGAKPILEHNSLFYTFLNPSEEDAIIEETSNLDNLNAPKKYTSDNAVGAYPLINGSTENTEQNFESAGTMAGGNTLFKPFITDDEQIITKQRFVEDIEIYTVGEGDTLGSIAQEFGISVQTILWENKLRAKDYIKPGQKLTILPTSGIRHTIKRGETIKKIALRYKVDEAKILEFNEISEPSQIKTGQKIIIPEGTPIEEIAPRPVKYIASRIFPAPRPAPIPSGMIWPTISKIITQLFNWRHTGLDIGGRMGDPIYAAADGTVIVSAWNSGGYGLQVVVDHGNGVKTRYAHCSKLLLSVGEQIKQGDTVCLLGSTGRSTGPHVHFEVLTNNVRKNPLQYVKK